MKKYITIAILAFTLLLASCSSGSTDKDNTNTREVTYTNTVGTYTQKVKKHIEKAAFFDMAMLDTFDSLYIDGIELGGAKDQVPSSLNENGKYNDMKNLGTLHLPNVEEVFKFSPDVIFISGRAADYFDELNKIAPVFYLTFSANTFIDNFKANLNTVAEVFNRVSFSKQISKEYDALINNIKAISSVSEETVSFVMYNNGYSVFGNSELSRYGWIYNSLGLKVADPKIESSTHGQSVTAKEYFANNKTDIILLMDRTSVVGGESEGHSNEFFSASDAYKNNRIYTLDANAWYITTGGFKSMGTMLNQVLNAINK
ncbi:MAG: siderophore ABC transporter substrate-binding protein [Anaeroplasmataceae bacterium]